VTAFSTTPEKEEEARRLGARHFVVSSDPRQMAQAANSMDHLLSTVTAPLDWNAWLGVLRPKGTLCILGASPGTLDIAPMALIVGQKSVRGSAIGGRATIREMLALAARHGIRAQTEVMPFSEVNAAMTRVRRNEARYRVVLVN
jgi:alcohol/geraniol dehydrogenase (NADP+)